MSISFAEYCEEFFESIYCDEKDKLKTDIAVRDALLDQYKLCADSDLETLANALKKFGVTDFNLPNDGTRYYEIAMELFDNFIYKNYGLPISYILARQVFEEVMLDRNFSTSLFRIVDGVGDLEDCSVVRRIIYAMCESHVEGFDDEYKDFIKRFPEFPSE